MRALLRGPLCCTIYRQGSTIPIAVKRRLGFPSPLQGKDQDCSDEKGGKLDPPSQDVGAPKVVEPAGQQWPKAPADPGAEEIQHPIGRPQDIPAETVGQQVGHHRHDRSHPETEQERGGEEERGRIRPNQEEHPPRHGDQAQRRGVFGIPEAIGKPPEEEPAERPGHADQADRRGRGQRIDLAVPGVGHLVDQGRQFRHHRNPVAEGDDPEPGVSEDRPQGWLQVGHSGIPFPGSHRCGVTVGQQAVLLRAGFAHQGLPQPHPDDQHDRRQGRKPGAPAPVLDDEARERRQEHRPHAESHGGGPQRKPAPPNEPLADRGVADHDTEAGAPRPAEHAVRHVELPGLPDEGRRKEARGHEARTPGDRPAGGDPVDQPAGEDPPDPVEQDQEGHPGRNGRAGPVQVFGHRRDEDAEDEPRPVVDGHDEQRTEDHIPAPESSPAPPVHHCHPSPVNREGGH